MNIVEEVVQLVNIATLPPAVKIGTYARNVPTSPPTIVILSLCVDEYINEIY
jgi:hypothetical protein